MKACMSLLNSSKGVTAWKKDKCPDFSILNSILSSIFQHPLHNEAATRSDMHVGMFKDWEL